MAEEAKNRRPSSSSSSIEIFREKDPSLENEERKRSRNRRQGKIRGWRAIKITANRNYRVGLTALSRHPERERERESLTMVNIVRP